MEAGDHQGGAVAALPKLSHVAELLVEISFVAPPAVRSTLRRRYGLHKNAAVDLEHMPLHFQRRLIAGLKT